MPLAYKAVAAVAKAVRKGQIQNLKTSVVKCTDCDERANHYDHRDYRQPLAVEPVCQRCNILRGKAEPYRTEIAVAPIGIPWACERRPPNGRETLIKKVALSRKGPKRPRKGEQP